MNHLTVYVVHHDTERFLVAGDGVRLGTFEADEFPGALAWDNLLETVANALKWSGEVADVQFVQKGGVAALEAWRTDAHELASDLLDALLDGDPAGALRALPDLPAAPGGN